MTDKNKELLALCDAVERIELNSRKDCDGIVITEESGPFEIMPVQASSEMMEAGAEIILEILDGAYTGKGLTPRNMADQIYNAMRRGWDKKTEVNPTDGRDNLIYPSVMAEFKRRINQPSEREKALEEIIRHMCTHSGYIRCGYDLMTTQEKLLFDSATSAAAYEGEKE